MSYYCMILLSVDRLVFKHATSRMRSFVFAKGVLFFRDEASACFGDGHVFDGYNNLIASPLPPPLTTHPSSSCHPSTYNTAAVYSPQPASSLCARRLKPVMIGYNVIIILLSVYSSRGDTV